VPSNGSIGSMARLKSAFFNKATLGVRRVALRSGRKISGDRAEENRLGDVRAYVQPPCLSRHKCDALQGVNIARPTWTR
jgi:hypothetical protein